MEKRKLKNDQQRAETESIRAETESIRAKTESLRAETGLTKQLASPEPTPQMASQMIMQQAPQPTATAQTLAPQVQKAVMVSPVMIVIGLLVIGCLVYQSIDLLLQYKMLKNLSMIAANTLYELKFYGGLLEEEDNFSRDLGNEFEYDEFIGKWIKKRKEKRSQNPKVIARREKRDEKRISKGRKPRFSRPVLVKITKPIVKQIAPDLPPKKVPIVSEIQVKKALVDWITLLNQNS